MEKILKKIGIDTVLLNEEPIHNRQTTMRILGISHTTLTRFEKENLIKSSRFKRKKYYTKETIIECVKNNLNLNLSNTPLWDNMW